MIDVLQQFFIIALAAACCNAQSYTKQGDFILGLVLPLHDTNTSALLPYDLINGCGDLNAEQTVTLSYFRRRIDEINNNGSILPGFNLGYSVLDTCNLPNLALAYASVWTDEKVRQNSDSPNWVTMALGGYNSRVSGPLTTYLQLYDIPMLDFAATSSDLSNKVRYPLYLRTVPSDLYQAQALVDLAKQMGLACVHLVYSEGVYGEIGGDNLRQRLAQANICLASHQKAPTIIRQDATEKFKSIVDSISATPSASVIMCFCEDTTIISLLSALQHKRYEGFENRFTIFASDYWGKSLRVQGLEDVADSAISLSIGAPAGGSDRVNQWLEPESTWFGEQVNTIYMQDPWYRRYLEERFHCTFDGLQGQLPCNRMLVFIFGSISTLL